MPTAYTVRLLMLVPAAQQAAANALAARATGDPADALTFTAALNASGLASDPPAHYAAFTSCTPAFLAGVPALQAQIPGSQHWSWEQAAVPADAADSVFAALGLRRVAPAS